MPRLQQLNTETGELRPYYRLSAAYALWLVLGLLGGHWMYLDRPRLATTYLFTCGVFGLGWMIDGINMPDYVYQANHGHRS